MGPHCDNFTKEGLDRMKKSEMPYKDGQKYAGMNNSQVYGSNVYVYTAGNVPMTMNFYYLNPRKGVGQKPTEYVTFKCFSIKCASGYLTVLDPLDDLRRKCLLADMSAEASIKSSVTDIFDMSTGCQ
jgi:hypothetical protein